MKVFLDLDGVLADFMGGALEAHGIHPDDYDPHGEWDSAKVLRMTEEEFWAPINEAGEQFWCSLDWMEDGREILKRVEDCYGPENICLLSSPSRHPGSASGKVKWIGKHLPGYSRRYFLGTAKEFIAGPGKLLIDDRGSNIDAFRNAGGEAILVPRPWNSRFSDTSSPALMLSLSLEAFL